MYCIAWSLCLGVDGLGWWAHLVQLICIAGRGKAYSRQQNLSIVGWSTCLKQTGIQTGTRLNQFSRLRCVGPSSLSSVGCVANLRSTLAGPEMMEHNSRFFGWALDRKSTFCLGSGVSPEYPGRVGRANGAACPYTCCWCLPTGAHQQEPRGAAYRDGFDVHLV